MELKEVIKNIRRYLDDSNELDSDELEIIWAGFNFLMFHIYTISKSKTVKVDEISIVKECLHVISEHLLLKGVSNNFALFTISFADMVYNWNDNFKKDSDIRLLCKYIYLTCSMRDVLRRNLSVSKMIYEHYKDLSGWMPPAFDINKAYLEKLLTGNEKSLGDNKS